MTVQDCYSFLDADYENTRKQMESDEELQRQLDAFVKDKTFYSLVLRLGERNQVAAHDLAVRLDERCGTLGLTRLHTELERLCEGLGSTERLAEVSYLLQSVMVEYERTVAAIKMVAPA